MKRLLTGFLAFSLMAGAFVPAFAQETGEIPAPETTSELPFEELVATTTESVSEQTPLAEIAGAEIATSTPEAGPVDPAEAPVELIIKFKESRADLDRTSGRREADAVIESADAVLEERLTAANSAVVSIDADADSAQVIRELERYSAVEYVEENHARSLFATTPNDTLFSTQWALSNTGQTYNIAGTPGADIDATLAWDLATGSPSVIVAVIDTGVLYTHPDLAGSMWDGSACVSETGAALGGCAHGYDFADNDAIPLPLATSSAEGYHGTHVAGIIGASFENATGTAGVAPGAKIMALRFGLDIGSEVKAIDFAIQNGVKIINASYGGDTYSPSEYEAIRRFHAAGGIFIAAAGNDGTDNDGAPSYPASYDLPNIVSVAATDNTDGLASFGTGGSNYGEESVDLGAPGRDIQSTTATNGTVAAYQFLSGTSMAAPQAAGVAALLRSLYPNATTTAYKSALMYGGDALGSLSGKTVSGNRLNAFGALNYLAADATAPVITLNGSATVSLTVGDTYTELGASVFDNIDGTYAATTTGAVDTSAAGTYTVTYSASDAAGNIAIDKTRTVAVSAPADPPRRRSGGGGGGGGGGSSRNKASDTATRVLYTTPASPYASMTPEQRAQLLQTLLTLLVKLQAQLAALQAQGR